MSMEPAALQPPASGPWGPVLVFVCALLLPAALPAQAGRGKVGADLRQKADEIRASAGELFKIRRIPWVTDPAEGFRLARKENRPVFLYLQAGDPLEDC